MIRWTGTNRRTEHLLLVVVVFAWGLVAACTGPAVRPSSGPSAARESVHDSFAVREPECLHVAPEERQEHGCRCPWGGWCACEYTLYAPRAGTCDLKAKMELEHIWSSASPSSSDGGSLVKGGVVSGGIYDEVLGKDLPEVIRLPLGESRTLCGRKVTCH